MERHHLLTFERWFSGFCASFSTPVPEDQRNIAIKQHHTREVCKNAVRLASDLDLVHEEALLAEAVALFHDVGRFPQYRQYRTFNDSVSVNHAALGAQVLLTEGVLRDLEQQERDLIIRTVMLHNVFSLPQALDERSLLHARIVRDADKLDILRVVIEYFSIDAENRAEAVAIGLPDVPGEYSTTVLDSLMRGEMAPKSLLRTLNDFKLLQLAWLYDINFTASLRMVQERNDIDRIEALLPVTGDIRSAVDRVRGYVAGRTAAS